MSLLLDALKKAALEKQRREQSEKNPSGQAVQDIVPHNAKPSSPTATPAAATTVDRAPHPTSAIAEDLSSTQPSVEIEAELLEFDLEEVERNYQLVSEEKNVPLTDNPELHQPEIPSTTVINPTWEIPSQESNTVSVQSATIVSETTAITLESTNNISENREIPVEKSEPLTIHSKNESPKVVPLEMKVAPLQMAEASPIKPQQQDNTLEANLSNESPAKKDFDPQSSKDSLYTLLSRSHKAAKAAQKRMILACAALVAISICLVGVYYYLLDSHPLTPQQPESSNVAAAPLSEEPQELVIAPENTDAANENQDVVNENADTLNKNQSLDTDTSNEANLASEALANPTAKAATENPASPSKELPSQKPLTDDEKSYSFPAEKPQTQVIETTQVNHDDLIVDPVYAGYKAYMAGDFPTAEAAYRTALAENPNRRDALLGAAAVAVQQNRYEDALRFYQQQLSRFPQDEYAQAGILSLSINNSDNPLFDSELNNLLRTYPNAAHLHFLKGSLCASRQQWAAAQISFFEAWRRDTQNPDYAFNLAVAMDHIQEPQEAIKFYQKALSSSNDHKVGFSIEAAQARIKELENTHK